MHLLATRWFYGERIYCGAQLMRAAIYARVSTVEQNCELQIRDLQEFTARQKWEITETYQDVISGGKSSRPALNRLMADVQARKFDCLLVWKLDRFGRSLVDCLNNIRTLEDRGIRFIAVTQRLDTDLQNPASRLLLHVLGAAEEFETSVDPRVDPRRPTTVQTGFREWEGGQDSQQPLRPKDATPPAKEDFQQGTGGRIATTGNLYQADRKAPGIGSRDRVPDAPGPFQELIVIHLERRGRRRHWRAHALP